LNQYTLKLQMIHHAQNPSNVLSLERFSEDKKDKYEEKREKYTQLCARQV